MSLASKDHKENFRLLDLSSDEESEDLHLEIIPSRKKKISRKERNRGSASKAPEPNIATEIKCALHWALRGTLILWLLMLTWICAALYDQVTVMGKEVAKVLAKYRARKWTLKSSNTPAKKPLTVTESRILQLLGTVSYAGNPEVQTPLNAAGCATMTLLSRHDDMKSSAFVSIGIERACLNSLLRSKKHCD